MELQNKLKHYFKENGLQMKWFAEKMGISKQQLYQVVGGFTPLPKKYWVKMIQMTDGKITLRDILEYCYRDIEELEFKEIGEIDSCKASLKYFNTTT